MNFMDETDCGHLFDQIDDLIAFPPEIECDDGNMLNSDDCKDFPSMWNDPFPETGHIFPVEQLSLTPELSAELFVPYEDIVQLEWLPTFGDDSFSSGAMTAMEKDSSLNKEPMQNQFQTTSPVSVLESSSSSSSSCSVGKMMHVSPSHPHTQRAPRSKRPRPTSFNPRTSIHERISPSSSFIVEAPKSLKAGNFADSKAVKAAGSEQKRKRKSKHTLPADATVRKCLHCETTKTPQWRAGPMGPKTLCNACGVRHKSGRLLPEYRPAASPTFVSLLHSNSHKKVVEMRSKATPKGTTPVDPKPGIVVDSFI